MRICGWNRIKIEYMNKIYGIPVTRYIIKKQSRIYHNIANIQIQISLNSIKLQKPSDEEILKESFKFPLKISMLKK